MNNYFPEEFGEFGILMSAVVDNHWAICLDSEEPQRFSGYSMRQQLNLDNDNPVDNIVSTLFADELLNIFELEWGYTPEKPLVFYWTAPAKENKPPLGIIELFEED